MTEKSTPTKKKSTKKKTSRRKASANPEAEGEAQTAEVIEMMDEPQPEATEENDTKTKAAGSSPQTDQELDAETQERYEEAKRADLTVRDLEAMNDQELLDLADSEGLTDRDIDGLSKKRLIFRTLEKHFSAKGLMYGEGVLEILPDGFGFLRSPEQSYLACPDDIYVSPSQIRRFGLKVGHVVAGTIRPPKESERYFALLRVDAINSEPPEFLNDLKDFDELTPLHPFERFVMETPGDDGNFEMRIVDSGGPGGQGPARPDRRPPPDG